MKKINLILELALKCFLLLALGILPASTLTTTGQGETQNFIDEAIKPFVRKFEKLSKSTYDGDVYFENLPDRTIGLGGVVLRNNRKFVKIDPNYWNNASDIDREFLIYHELTHSQFEHFSHEEGFLANGCPVSIMAAETYSSVCSRILYSYYIRELQQNFYEVNN